MFELCCISDLRNKEVINICDGRRFGFLIDVEINICDGKVVSLVVPGDSKVSLFGKNQGINIPWCQIDKIGDDIIVVNVGELYLGEKNCCDNKKRR